MTKEDNALSRLTQRWIEIADALSLRITAPASILLPSGHRLNADALLLDFGGPRGMLLVTDDEIVWPHRSAIVDAGYGFSVLSEPSADSVMLKDEAINVLRDWGWGGDPVDAPPWMHDT